MTGEALPLVVSKHVISDHAHGAVMGVAAHDARDANVASSLGLGSESVLRPPDEATVPEGDTYEGEGTLCNSAEFDGMSSSDARGAHRLVALAQ